MHYKVWGFFLPNSSQTLAQSQKPVSISLCHVREIDIYLSTYISSVISAIRSILSVGFCQRTTGIGHHSDFLRFGISPATSVSSCWKIHWIRLLLPSVRSNLRSKRGREEEIEGKEEKKINVFELQENSGFVLTEKQTVEWWLPGSGGRRMGKWRSRIQTCSEKMNAF